MATLRNRLSRLGSRLRGAFTQGRWAVIGQPRPRPGDTRRRVVVSGQHPRFTNQDVEVDGNRYEGAVFVNCTLVYHGGELPTFANCTFRQVKLRLEGQALNTAQYLQDLYNLGLSPAVEKVASSIQQNALPLTEQPVPPPALNLGTNYGQLAGYGLVLVAVAGLLGAALWYGFYYYPVKVALASEPARPLFKSAVYDLMPALPADLADRYDQWKAAQLEQLNSFGWVDQTNGVARIPIDQAMDLLIEQGLPTQDTASQ